jgi:hypothetical protein
MEQVAAPAMQRIPEESVAMDFNDKVSCCSYEDRYEEVKMNVSSPFTRYITLSNNVRDSISQPYPCVPVLVYNPRTGSDVIVTR